MKDLHSLGIISFPDGHKHLKLKDEDLNLTEISLSITSFDDLFLLYQLASLCPNLGKIRINYLLGARCDRQFSKGEARDLGIIASYINDMDFDVVEILKPHSEVSLDLINNSTAISVTKQLLGQCISYSGITDCSIIAPDKGAAVWIEKELERDDIVKCNKTRVEGKVDKIEIPADAVIKPTCIIVDDLCDGGATFIQCSKELRKRGAREVHLVVTHGIFSKGFEELDQWISTIHCTNSFKDVDDDFLRHHSDLIVEQLKVR